VRPDCGQDARAPAGRDARAPARDARAPKPARRSRPPHNPGLRELIAGKRAWSEPFAPADIERGFRSWHARGYLPHFDAPGAIQFVTFRLADSMPAARRSEWAALLALEDDRERRKQIEAYLDNGLGECWLRRPAIAGLVEGALRHFDGERYRLCSWVVMPNHVHVLVETTAAPLPEILHSWKSFTAKAANGLLDRSGPFWGEDYFDRYIRDEAHFRKARRYIEANPVKAGLVRDAAEWPWSSARLAHEMEGASA
jgi:REP element-mobilizing transposase RayT